MCKASQRPADVNTVDEEVFRHAFIPRTLDEVPHFVRDAENAKDNGTDSVSFTM